MTEIALVKMWGTHIVAQWSSLVNPGCPIPPYITQLTGITDAMVADAPDLFPNSSTPSAPSSGRAPCWPTTSPLTGGLSVQS